jgi:glycerophosphoryl diester phosphodiesterase
MNKLFLLLAGMLVAGAGCSTSTGGTAGTAGTGGAGGTAGAGGTGAVGGTGGSGGASSKCVTPGEILRCDGVVLNIAHRGGRRVWPEHTLFAYEEALASGTDVLELDIHETSDGVIVIMHDSTINRTTDGTGAIKDMTFAELRTYDAGYDFTTDGGTTYPYRDMGLVVPTLEEVFEEFPDAPYVIEIKQGDPSIVDDFVAMSREYDKVDQMNGAAFDDDILVELREAAPEMGTSFGEQEVLVFFVQSSKPDGVDPDYVPPAEFLQVPPNIPGTEDPLVDDRFVTAAHALGLKVHVWTINEEEEMRTLIEDVGVDGVMTYYPPLLTSVIEDTGTGFPE